MHDLTASAGPDAVDELDLALVHALQLAPRASWSDLAPVLGTSPTTLARRWRRLESAGAAWMTCHFGLPPGAAPKVNCVALVEATVVPGRIPGVVAELSRHPELISIEHLTGARDLFMTAAASDAARLAHYLQVELPAVPGVSGIRLEIPRRVYRDTGGWRLRALDLEQRRRVAGLARVGGDFGGAPGESSRVPGGPSGVPYAPAPPVGEARVARRPVGPYALDEHDYAILTALGPDGRLGTAELARRLGLGGTTVSRRLGRLVGAGYARFRTEVARSLTGWPVTATWWLRVPPGELDATARQLAAFADMRMCASVTGTANLVAVMWLRHTADATAVEAEWARRFPRLEIQDSAVTLQVVKTMNRLLDADGYSVGFVPARYAGAGRGGPASA